LTPLTSKHVVGGAHTLQRHVVAAIRFTIPIVVVLRQNELAAPKRIPFLYATIVVVVVACLGDEALHVDLPDIDLAVAYPIPLGPNDPAVPAPQPRINRVIKIGVELFADQLAIFIERQLVETPIEVEVVPLLHDMLPIAVVKAFHVDFAIKVHVCSRAVATASTPDVFNIDTSVFVDIGCGDLIPFALGRLSHRASRQSAGGALAASHRRQACQDGKPNHRMREIAHVCGHSLGPPRTGSP